MADCTECKSSLADGIHSACFEKTPAIVMLGIRAMDLMKSPDKKKLMSEARLALKRFLPDPIPALPKPQRDDWAEDYFNPWLAEQPMRKKGALDE